MSNRTALARVGLAFEFGVFTHALLAGPFAQPPMQPEDRENGIRFGSKLARLLGVEGEFLHMTNCENTNEAERYVDNELGARIIALGADICNSYNLGLAHFKISFIGSYQESHFDGKARLLVETGVREFVSRAKTLPIAPSVAKYNARVWNEWRIGKCTPEQADVSQQLIGRYIQSSGWIPMIEIERFFEAESSAESPLHYESAKEFLSKLNNDFPNEQWWNNIEDLGLR